MTTFDKIMATTFIVSCLSAFWFRGFVNFWHDNWAAEVTGWSIIVATVSAVLLMLGIIW